MGRRGSYASFIDAFTSGYDQGRKMVKDYDVAQVLNAKPEEIEGYTSETGGQINAMANAKDENGNPYYTIGFDDKSGNYTATPNFGDSPQAIAMQKGVRTQFLGNEIDGQLSDAQMNAIRNSKMADVMMRHDPMEGMRMKRDMQQGQLTDLQIKGAERQERSAQREEDKTSLMDRIKSSVMDFTKSIIKTDESGRPVAPTSDDMFEINKHLVGSYLENGLTEEAMAASRNAMADYANSLELNKKQRQSDVESASALVGAGNYSGAMQVYDKYLKDGFRAVDATENKDGSIVVRRVDKDGAEATPITFKSRNELLAGLQSMVDSKFLLSEAQRRFENDVKLRGLANQERQTSISGGHLRLAQAKDERDASDKRAAQDAAGSLYVEQNPGASNAQIEAVRRGILPAVPKAGEYKVESGDVTTLLGKPLLDKEGNPILDANSRPMVSRDPVKEKQFMQFMSRNNITDTNKGLLMFLGQGDAPRFNSEAEAEAAFKAGKIKSGQMVNIGGRAGTWR